MSISFLHQLDANNGAVSLEMRRKLAAQAFATSAVSYHYYLF